jgi:hypothetical protein
MKYCAGVWLVIGESCSRGLCMSNLLSDTLSQSSNWMTFGLFAVWLAARANVHVKRWLLVLSLTFRLGCYFLCGVTSLSIETIVIMQFFQTNDLWYAVLTCAGCSKRSVRQAASMDHDTVSLLIKRNCEGVVRCWVGLDTCTYEVSVLCCASNNVWGTAILHFDVWCSGCSVYFVYLSSLPAMPLGGRGAGKRFRAAFQ